MHCAVFCAIVLTDPLAEEIAQAVWDEVAAAHTAVGTMGKQLRDAKNAAQNAFVASV